MSFYKEKNPKVVEAVQYNGMLSDVEHVDFLPQVSQELRSKDLIIESLEDNIIYTVSPGSWLVNDSGYVKTMTNYEFMEKYEEITY